MVAHMNRHDFEAFDTAQLNSRMGDAGFFLVVRTHEQLGTAVTTQKYIHFRDSEATLPPQLRQHA
jgi:hypothetical protein